MKKLSSLDSAGNWVDHDYGNVYFRQKTTSGERLVIGPSTHHVELMVELAQSWHKCQFWILYVLIESGRNRPGRYESPVIESLDDLQVFFFTYETLFETDGSHHVWIGSVGGEDLLVYDQHDVVFAYGDLSAYERILGRHGFSRRDFSFPAPHSHHFHPEYAVQEDEMFKHFQWKYSSPRPADNW